VSEPYYRTIGFPRMTDYPPGGAGTSQEGRVEPEQRDARDLRRVAIAYVVVASLWIAFSDLAVAAVSTSAEQAAQFQVIKGWLFVAVTGLLLAGLLAHLGTRIDRSVGSLREALGRVASRERRISQIVETALDAVISIDRDGHIVAWNHRADEMFGWGGHEVIGRPLHEVCLPQRFRDRHLAGMRRYIETGVGPLMDRRTRIRGLHREGHEFPIELSITASEIDGELLFSGFIRDLTAQIAAEEKLERTLREREAVTAALHRIRAGSTASETALTVCQELAELPNVASVSVLHLRGDGTAVPLAAVMPPHPPATTVAPLPADRAAHLIARAATGPWIEEHEESDVRGDYGSQLAARGLRATGYVPLVDGDERPRALLVAGTAAASSVDVLTDLFPALQQFAVVSSTVLLPQLDAGGTSTDLHRELTKVIETSAFRSVFQPIVRLDDLGVVGFEALTRFDDAASPEQRFGAANSLGLEVDLEEACLATAVVAAQALPAGTWLALNVSPAVLLDSSRLGTLLTNVGRPVLIEVTERTPITDYAAIRAALDRLPVPANLAIDDAGAGYASLRHIVELRPTYVKLHIGLVRGIDGDPVRQAMVAGMVHFAREVGCHLVAEGVETAAEREELVGLGVEFGQGYLFGRPAPAS
jgi:PAS domain S-box-containing protein